MPDTFAPTIPPQEDPSGDNRFNVTAVQFGEGYEQVWGEGMNDKIQTWPFTWNGTEAEILPIRDFFDSQGGYKRFYYQPPGGAFTAPLLWRVKRYTLVPAAAGNMKISASFEQAFGP